MKSLSFIPIALTLPLSAALTHYEPFDYPAGTGLDGLNGGTGWGAAWSDGNNDVTTGSGSLNYPAAGNFSSSGNQVNISSSVTNAQAVRALGTTMNLATSGNTFYASALFQISAVSGQGSSLNFTSETDGTGFNRWRFGINDSGNFYVGMDPLQANQLATSTSTASAGTTYLLVAKMRTNTGGGDGNGDQVFLKIYEAGDSIFEPLTDGDWDLSAIGYSGVTLRSLRLDLNNAAGQSNQLDEIRIGTSFADVAPIPEPSALLLLGLSPLALLRRRL
ncbi:MAG: hypothetical protein ACQKBY_00795 [Verrucomicrobiales bacterium]